MAGERGLRVHALGLPVEDQTRLAERVHRLNQLRRGRARQIDEGPPLVRQQRMILPGRSLRHEPGELAGKRGAVADNVTGPGGDRPGLDRPRQGDTVTVDDVAARRQQRIDRGDAGRAVGEDLQHGQPPDDDEGDSDEQQHDQHQPVIGQGKSPLLRLLNRRA